MACAPRPLSLSQPRPHLERLAAIHREALSPDLGLGLHVEHGRVHRRVVGELPCLVRAHGLHFAPEHPERPGLELEEHVVVDVLHGYLGAVHREDEPAGDLPWEY